MAGTVRERRVAEQAHRRSAPARAFAIVVIGIGAGTVVGVVSGGDSVWPGAVAFFALTIVVAARVGGLSPGLVATVMSVLVSGYLEHREGVRLASIASTLNLTLFAVAGIAISVTSEKTSNSGGDSRDLIEKEPGILRALTEGAPIGILMLDRELHVVAVSQRWLDDVQMSREDVIGRNHYECFPDLPEAWKEVHRRGLNGETVTGRDDSYLAPDGKRHWVNWQVVPWGDSGSRTGGILITAEDTTERRQAEQAAEQWHRAFQQSESGIVLSGAADGRIDDVNLALARMLGYRREELIGRSMADLYPAAELEGRARSLQIADSDAGHALFESSLLRKDNSEFPVLVDITAVKDTDGAVISHVKIVHDLTGIRSAQTALQESNDRFRRLFDADIVGILVTDARTIRESNDHFLRMIGYTRDEFFRSPVSWQQITPAEMIPGNEERLASLLVDGVCPAFEKEYLRKDGSRIPVLFTAVALNQAERLCFVVDLTERKNLERQFRQAQKLESIGLLAGGVAHDFNNLLTVILGYTEMALDRVPQEASARKSLDQVSEAATRAAALTRQLLTFSRQNASQPRVLCIEEVLRGIEPMLLRLLGESIEMAFATAAQPKPIFADPGLIEQVIVNLAVNARDAMPNGGQLLIETSSLTVCDEFASQSFSVPEGQYASLEVADTGTGMSPEVQLRLFEPFFTTKEPGKGTGLGLSTVYGIVTQSGGSIKVYSTPGVGTTFRILFPVPSSEKVATESKTDEPVRGGAETILIVEDERGVRNYLHEVLSRYGYTTLAARDGAEAIEMAQQHEGLLHLMITDLGLPGIGGDEVIREMKEINPDTKILRMSGYPERFGAQRDSRYEYLQKPFIAEALLRKVRGILDRSPELV